MTSVNARADELADEPADQPADKPSGDPADGVPTGGDPADERAANVAADVAAESAAVAARAAPSGVDRRERLRSTIESLLRRRQDVKQSYAKLAGVSSIDQRDSEPFAVDHEHLRRFCQIMVDYTAMGHFEVYQRIIEGMERRQAVKDAANDVYPAIAETTDYLVDFDDRYENFDASPDELERLKGDLSRLGEIIVLRSKFEDQILAALSR